MLHSINLKKSKYIHILQAIDRHGDIKTISNILQKKYHTVRKTAYHLEEMGLVHHIKYGNRIKFGLTPTGKNYMIKAASLGSEEVKVWRLHSNIISFDILKKPANWNKMKPQILIKEDKFGIRQVRLNNNTQEILTGLPCTAKLTNNKLIIYLNEVYALTPERADIEAIQMLNRILPTFEKHLKQIGITIRKPNYGVRAANYAHYARERDELAVLASEHGEHIHAVDGDGEERVKSDSSKGYPELEFPHPRYSQGDAEKYNKFLMKVVEDKVALRVDTDNITRALITLADNQNRLIKATETVSEVLGGVQGIQAKLILSSSYTNKDEVEGWS